ncbi:MAG: hypothetical protein ACJA0J_002430, partial [Bdellovibrionota bacterium]
MQLILPGQRVPGSSRSKRIECLRMKITLGCCFLGFSPKAEEEQ